MTLASRIITQMIHSMPASEEDRLPPEGNRLPLGEESERTTH